MYKAERQDEIVPKVKAILADRFAKAAAMEVVELVHGKQYMVIEKRGSTLNINLTAHQQAVVMEDVNMNRSNPGQPFDERAKSNLLTVDEKTCSVGGGRSINIHASMLWHFSRNGKTRHSHRFYSTMFTITTEGRLYSTMFTIITDN